MGNFLNSGNSHNDEDHSQKLSAYTYDIKDEEIEQEIIDSTFKKNWYFYFGNRYNENIIEAE
jgi:hypothetical protein